MAKAYPKHFAGSDEVCAKVAALTGLDRRAVRRAVDDGRTRLATRIAVRDALVKLEIEVPTGLATAGMSRVERDEVRINELIRAGHGPQGRDGLGGGKVRA